MFQWFEDHDPHDDRTNSDPALLMTFLCNSSHEDIKKYTEENTDYRKHKVMYTKASLMPSETYFLTFLVMKEMYDVLEVILAGNNDEFEIQFGLCYNKVSDDKLLFLITHGLNVDSLLGNWFLDEVRNAFVINIVGHMRNLNKTNFLQLSPEEQTIFRLKYV